MIRFWGNEFFQQLLPEIEFTPIQRIGQLGKHDVVCLAHWSNWTDDLVATIETWAADAKQVLIYHVEPTFVDQTEALWNLPFDNVSVYADVVRNRDYRNNFATAISWWLSPWDHFKLGQYQAWLERSLEHHQPKPFVFSCLMGQQKEHRDWVERSWHQSQNQHRILLNYYKSYPQLALRDSYPMELRPIQDLPGRSCWWADPLGEGVYRGAQFFPPIEVYNLVSFDIVTETVFHNQYAMYTEKTAKTILSRKPFVAICGQHFLRGLRSLGFKTFDDIIDESYDAEPDQEKRWHMAWAEIERLCIQLDQSRRLDALQTVLDHNYHHFIRTDWHGAIKQQVTQIQVSHK